MDVGIPLGPPRREEGREEGGEEVKTPPKKSESGKIITCKFCRRAVWMNLIDNRVFELIGDEPHADVCERRKAHFKAQGAAANQARRDKR